MNCWSILFNLLLISAIIGSYIWIGVLQTGNAPLSQLNVNGDGSINGNLIVGGTISSQTTQQQVSDALSDSIVTHDLTWSGTSEGTFPVLSSEKQIIDSEMKISTTTLSVSGRRIIDLADPCLDTDAVNKQWVEQHCEPKCITNVEELEDVLVSTINSPELDPLRTFLGENLFLQLVPGLTIDSKVLAVGDRILILNHNLPQINGIYVIGDPAGYRSTDFSHGKLLTFNIQVNVLYPEPTNCYLLQTPPTSTTLVPNVDQQATGDATDSCDEPYDPFLFVKKPCCLKMHDWDDDKKEDEDVVGCIPLVNLDNMCKSKCSPEFTASISPEGIVNLIGSNPMLLTLGAGGQGLRFRALNDMVYIDMIVDGGESTMSLEFGENSVQFVATP